MKNKEAITSPPNNLPFRKSHAVLIGVDNYSHFEPLDSAVNDVETLADILSEYHNFEISALLLDPTAGQLKGLLAETLPKLVEPEDRLLFYFAGHGIAEDGEEGPAGYILPADANHRIENSFVSMRDLNDALNCLSCKHLMLIMDCCFSGVFRWSSRLRAGGRRLPKNIYKERFDRFLQEPAWQVLTSSAHDQEALDSLSGQTFGSRGQVSAAKRKEYEKWADKAHSPFAIALYEGLSGDADVTLQRGRGDGVITATELYVYIRDRLEPETIEHNHRQTPGFYPLPKHDSGEFIFLHPRHPLNLQSIPTHNPYKGLQPFNEADADWFYGRDKVIEDLNKFVRLQPLTVVSGVSGSGKSSLIRAGIIPKLKEEGYKLLPVLRPGSYPLSSLRYSLGLGGKAPGIEDIDKLFLQKYQGQKILLVVDQFEELITRCKSDEERDQFMFLLKHIFDHCAGIELVSIITIRSDFEPQFDRGLLKTHWQKGRKVIPPFSVEEFREVIELPADQEALVFEPPELVDEIVEEVFQAPGALPLLSYTLSELYESYLARKDYDRCLTREDYKNLGGVMGALRNKADGLYESLDEPHKKTMRRVVLRMISIGGELAGRHVNLDELVYDDPLENQRVKTILDLLHGARLIVVKEKYVEPAHDALVRAWGRVWEWIHAEGEERLLLHEKLGIAANDYLKYDNAKLLWNNDPRLAQLSTELRDKEQSILNSTEREFITRSVQRKRRLSLFLWSTVIAIIVSLSSLTFYAFQQQDEAERKRLEANYNLAKNFEREATNAIVNAMDNSDSEENFRRAWLYTLSALNIEIASDKRLPLSIGRLQLPELRYGVWHQVWSTSPGSLPESILSLTYSPDDSFLAGGFEDGTIRLWDIRSGEEVSHFSGHKSFIACIAFSLDGKQLAAGSDRTVRLWDIESGMELAAFIGHDNPVKSIVFSPDGKRLASSSGQSVRLWDAESGTTLTTFRQDSSWVYSVAFSLDGEPWALTGTRMASKRNIQLWDINTAEALLPTMEVKDRDYTALNLHGTRLAIKSEDKTVHVWDIGMGSVVSSFSGPHDGFDIAAFSPDGKRLAFQSRSARGAKADTVSVWDVDTGAELNSLIRRPRSSIYDVTFSPDGTKLKYNGVKVWNIATGQEQTAFERHASDVISAAFSFDDQQLVSRTADNTLHFWDVETGEELRSYNGESAAGRHLAFSPDGRRRLAAEGNTIHLWDLESGKVLTSFREESDIDGVTFSPDGTRLALIWRYGQLKVRDIETGEVLLIFGEESDISDVTFSPDGARLVYYSVGNSVRLWDVLAGEKLDLIGEPGNDLWSFAISSDGTRLASGSADNVIRLWDVASGAEIAVLSGHSRYVNSLAFSPDGKRLASGSADNTVRLWDIASGAELAAFNGHSDIVADVTFNSDGTQLASGSVDNTVRLWQVEPDIGVRIFNGFSSITNVAIGSDGRQLAFEQENPRKHTWPPPALFNRLWDVKAGMALTAFISGAYGEGGICAALSADASRLAVANAELYLWDDKNGTSLVDSTGGYHIRDMVFSPDGRRLAINTYESVEVWDLQNDDTVAIMKKDDVVEVALTPDGEKLALVGRDHKIRLCDAETGRELVVFDGHRGDVTSLAFSPDGRRLVSGSADATVRLWDAGTGEELLTFRGHGGSVNSVVFSPDGQRVASGSDDNTVRLWDVETGEELATFLGHSASVLSIAFSPDGRQLISGSEDGSVRTWSYELINAYLSGGRESSYFQQLLQASSELFAFHLEGFELKNSARKFNLRPTGKPQIAEFYQRHRPSGKDPIAWLLEMIEEGQKPNEVPDLVSSEAPAVNVANYLDPSDDGRSASGRDPGITDEENSPIQLWVDLPWSKLVERNDILLQQGMGLVDVESYMVDGRRVFLGIWRSSQNRFLVMQSDDSENFRDNWNELRDMNYEIIDCEVFVEGNRRTIVGVWKSQATERRMHADASWSTLLSAHNDNQAAGFRLTNVEAYQMNGDTKYVAIWETGSDTQEIVRAASHEEFMAKLQEFNASGIGLVDIEVVLEGGEKLYLGVGGDSYGEYELGLKMDFTDFLQRNKEYQQRNLILEDIEVTTIDGAERKLTGIWREAKDVVVSRLADDSEF